MATNLNAWGEEVGETKKKDPWWVPEEERLDDDEADTNPFSNALEGGDDLDGWKPGDPV